MGILSFLEKKLNRSGFNTKSTDKGKTLLSWVEQGEGDLIITDVVMEDSNGLDLLERASESIIVEGIKR